MSQAPKVEVGVSMINAGREVKIIKNIALFHVLVLDILLEAHT